MNDQMVKEIIARLDALAAKLGVAAETLLGWAARQVYVDGWLTLTKDCILLGLGAVLYARGEWKLVVINRPGFHGEDSYPTQRCIMRMLGTALLAVGFLYGMNNLDYVFRMFNPQYAAVRNLVNLLK